MRVVFGSNVSLEVKPHQPYIIVVRIHVTKAGIVILTSEMMEFEQMSVQVEAIGAIRSATQRVH